MDRGLPEAGAETDGAAPPLPLARRLQTGAGRAAHALRGAGKAALGLVLPPTCVSCGAIVHEAGGLCGACWRRLAFIERPYCERLGIPFAFEQVALDPEPRLSPQAVMDPPAFDRARAAVLFGDIARDLVHGLKYGDRLDMAAPMARLMARAAGDLLAEADLIVPVPLHPLRLWRRRFNQAALLARRLSKASGVPCRTDVLVRARATSSQVSLSRAERRANVAGAFKVPPQQVHHVTGRRILIVDDVLTTGATLDACAQALRYGKATHIDAVTFARVVEAG
ncbi:ComF family protein [Xanthobacter sp. DSM 24535]|uniref:ComF family protein n=1 Tax=Roseixanthobacter psychrophilus TaxID=3119917 RepID=UPI00372710BA